MKKRIVAEVLIFAQILAVGPVFADQSSAASVAQLKAEIAELQSEAKAQSISKIHPKVAAALGAGGVLSGIVSWKAFDEAARIGRTKSRYLRALRGRLDGLGILTGFLSAGSLIGALAALSPQDSGDRAVANAKITEVKLGQSSSVRATASARASGTGASASASANVLN